MDAPLKDRILAVIRSSPDWMMIKDIIYAAKLVDVDRMFLSGYLEALADAGLLESKRISSAKLYRIPGRR